MPHQLSDVKVVNFKDTWVGALEHRSDAASIDQSVSRFIAWRKHNHLHPAHSATFNILYDVPNAFDPAHVRMDLCAAVERNTDDSTFGVSRKVIPGGRCAMLRHLGFDEALGPSVAFLYRDWLPQSGEEARDFPLFLQRVRFYPEVAESEAMLDLYLPLK